RSGSPRRIQVERGQSRPGIAAWGGARSPWTALGVHAAGGPGRRTTRASAAAGAGAHAPRAAIGVGCADTPLARPADAPVGGIAPDPRRRAGRGAGPSVDDAEAGIEGAVLPSEHNVAVRTAVRSVVDRRRHRRADETGA